MDIGGIGGGSLRLPDDLNDLYQPSYTGNVGGAARISSNSWGDGGSQGRYTLASMQTDQFVWTHPDYLIAFASGNVGVFGTVQAPGTSKNSSPSAPPATARCRTQLASFSSRGPTRDGRRKPTVMAPGDIVTSSIGSTRYTYAAYSGTSMATPAVAGAMALVRQYLTDGWYPTGAPVPANALQAVGRAAPGHGRERRRATTSPASASPTTRSATAGSRIDDVLYFPGDSSRTLLVDTRDGLDGPAVRRVPGAGHGSQPAAQDRAVLDGCARQPGIAGAARERPGPRRDPRRLDLPRQLHPQLRLGRGRNARFAERRGARAARGARHRDSGRSASRDTASCRARSRSRSASPAAWAGPPARSRSTASSTASATRWGSR